MTFSIRRRGEYVVFINVRDRAVIRLHVFPDRCSELLVVLPLRMSTFRYLLHDLMEREPSIRRPLQRALFAAVILSRKHLAYPARAYCRAVPEVYALVIPAWYQPVNRDVKRGSHQEHLVKPRPAQASLEGADSASAPGGKAAAPESLSCLLLRQAQAAAFLGEALADQLMHLHLPSICEAMCSDRPTFQPPWLLDLAPDRDTEILTAFIQAAGPGQDIVLTADGEAAYQRYANRANRAWTGGNPLTRYLY